MAKKIQVSDALAIEFEQRARGEETPWWVGAIHQKEGRGWKLIGRFENGGTGGDTFFSHAVVSDGKGGWKRASDLDAAELLKQLVSTANVGGYDMHGGEAEAVVYWAEQLGYELGCDFNAWTLTDYLDMQWGATLIVGSKREGNPQRHAVAKAKFERLYWTKKAIADAKKGKTTVQIGDGFYTYKTRDRAQIIAAAQRQHGKTVTFLEG